MRLGTIALLGMAAAFLVAAVNEPPLRAMQWLKVEGGAEAMVAAVNYDSGVCLPNTITNEIAAGQILFRSPSLLGGQAAKARLSCQSCHLDGGDNPNFHFAGASSAPGTADVSNSFFSAAGGNGTFDPAVIPSLARQGKISRSAPGVLEDFLQELIVKEFAGEQPSLRVIDNLAAYIRALEPCKANSFRRQRGQLVQDFYLVTNAIGYAETAVQLGKADQERLAIAAARDILALMHERYDTAKTAKIARQIEQFSIDLGAASREANEDERFVLYESIDRAFFDYGAQLKAAEDDSLYNPAILRSALE